MSRRSRPHYHSGLEWILGVAFEDTLTRPARLAQGFTHVRCCGSPRASSPHGLAAPALASRDGRDCVQLPPARGCYHLAPRRTFTSNPCQAHLRRFAARNDDPGREQRWRNKGALQAFLQAFPKIACFAPSFSKLIFGGFAEFQGVTRLPNVISWFPNFSLRSPPFGRILGAITLHSAA